MIDFHNFCAVADDNIDGRPGSDEDVSWFEISMEVTFAVKVLDGLSNLEHDLQVVFARKTSGIVVDLVLQTATSTELHNEDVSGWVGLVFTVVDELDNLGLNICIISIEIQLYSTERLTWLSLVRFLASFRR
jgi:hypothetical protein